MKLRPNTHKLYENRDGKVACRICDDMLEIGGEYVPKFVGTTHWTPYCVPCAKLLNIVA